MLIHNAGHAVPLVQLIHPFSGKEFPSAHLNAHIAELRRRVGIFRTRNRTVKNQGYVCSMADSEGVPLVAKTLETGSRSFSFPIYGSVAERAIGQEIHG